MDIVIRIDNRALEQQIQNTIFTEIGKEVKIRLDTLYKGDELTKLIEKVVQRQIEQSKYVSNSIIRNLVQQKIAREIADKIVKP